MIKNNDDDDQCIDDDDKIQNLNQTGGGILRSVEPVDRCHHAGEVNVAVEHCLMVIVMIIMMVIMIMVMMKMMIMVIMMFSTICPASTVKLFMLPAILGPPVHVFPKRINILFFSLKHLICVHVSMCFINIEFLFFFPFLWNLQNTVNTCFLQIWFETSFLFFETLMKHPSACGS